MLTQAVGGNAPAPPAPSINKLGSPPPPPPPPRRIGSPTHSSDELVDVVVPVFSVGAASEKAGLARAQPHSTDSSSNPALPPPPPPPPLLQNKLQTLSAGRVPVDEEEVADHHVYGSSLQMVPQVQARHIGGCIPSSSFCHSLSELS
jgi:hypothetical protein